MLQPHQNLGPRIATVPSAVDLPEDQIPVGCDRRKLMMLDFSKLTLEIGLLRSGYRTGDFTPVEVVREVYRRIREAGDFPIWIHLVPESEALERAEALLDHLNLPLAGIPFAIKDNIDAEGMPTTAGCPAFAYLAGQSATAVRLLEAAGAILIGKTHMDQFATGLVGVRSPQGPCPNAFHPGYISGGSSSGSAVATALGMVTFALGTDTAGSGRVPAALNNLIGVKPTRGLVSTTGVVPACRSLDCVSIFAADISDAATVLDTIAQDDASDPWSRTPQSVPPRFHKPFRFGVPQAGQLEFFGDDAAKELFARAVGQLEKIGGTRVEFDYAPFRQAASLLYEGAWLAERFHAVGEFIDSHPDAVDPVVASIISKAKTQSATAAFDGFYRLAEIKKTTSSTWKEINFMVLPTTPTTYRIQSVLADPIALNANLGIYTNFVNLLDLAAVAVPAGFRPDGLPLGVQLIGPAFSDWELIRVAKGFLGAATPERKPRPVEIESECVVTCAVVGAHLSGMPLNAQLTDLGANFLESVQTAPNYALFALPTEPPKPGMVCLGENQGVCIEAELWSLSHEAFGKFVAAVPPPLCIGSITLKDGRTVKGFLCEDYATRRAKPISAFGGWRDYVASFAS